MSNVSHHSSCYLFSNQRSSYKWTLPSLSYSGSFSATCDLAEPLRASLPQQGEHLWSWISFSYISSLSSPSLTADGQRVFATITTSCRQRAGWCAVGQAQSERMELEHVHKIRVSLVTKHLTTTRGSRVEHFKRECSIINFIKHELASFHLCTQPITDTIFSSSQNLCVENIDNAKMMQLQMLTSLTYSPHWNHMGSLHGLNQITSPKQNWGLRGEKLWLHHHHTLLLFLLSAQLTHHRSLVPFIQYTPPGFCEWCKAHGLLVGQSWHSMVQRAWNPYSRSAH